MTAIDEDVRTTSDEAPETARAVAPKAGERTSPYPDVSYGRRLTRLLPAMHTAFNWLNRFVGVPALRLGLGRYWATPLSGYMMLLRTTGRKSGRRREAPLGYVIVGDAVYCMAGFGRNASWFQNLLADPHVEIVLPDRAFSGIAEEVTDPDEIRRVLRPLAASMAIVALLLTGVNPRTASDDEIMRVFGQFPLVRIRPTGIAAGPNDPGGLGWVIAAAETTLATLWIARAVSRCAAGVARVARR